ncbi:hypothetical protein SECTIM467_178 [Brevibacillus phage SecTim467]|uniref:Uncharacterized protein n=2 Tax=Jenstvirus jenst TaxID=1982225 RepID=A0A0K2CPK7_9CAUD|nr:hypothetical protein AVV11_gp018 [Brevibacillus phage Jenst]ALA07302.1 hypothetical protein JENST_173 [Brevibacillus phage Jenst]ALA07499.1 hypothetical protein SECTIM467_178 [Brevibacillus phage SecTim467]
MSKMIRFTFDRMATPWDNEQGAATSSQFWHVATEKVEFILSDELTATQALEKALAANYVGGMEIMVFEDGRLTGNRIENGDGKELTSEDCDNYQKIGKPMYLVDYSIYVKIYEVTEPDTAALCKLFPELKQY